VRQFGFHLESILTFLALCRVQNKPDYPKLDDRVAEQWNLDGTFRLGGHYRGEFSFAVLRMCMHGCMIYGCSSTKPTSLLQQVTRPLELWYATVNFPICALYCNSLLGNLNMRNRNKAKLGQVHDLGGSTFPLTTVGFTAVEVERSVVDDSKIVSDWLLLA
jgi:hypothetical protein